MERNWLVAHGWDISIDRDNNLFTFDNRKREVKAYCLSYDYYDDGPLFNKEKYEMNKIIYAFSKRKEDKDFVDESLKNLMVYFIKRVINVARVKERYLKWTFEVDVAEGKVIAHQKDSKYLVILDFNNDKTKVTGEEGIIYYNDFAERDAEKICNIFKECVE